MLIYRTRILVFKIFIQWELLIRMIFADWVTLEVRLSGQELYSRRNLDSSPWIFIPDIVVSFVDPFSRGFYVVLF